MQETDFDVIIVGAGFSGVYMLHKCRSLGLSARVIEAGTSVGGTWYWNRYPGARCDVESMTYSYSFLEDLEQEWHWPERYAKQSEILRYIDHVVDRLGMRKDIQTETRVTEATFNEATNRWTVVTDPEEQFTAKYCIMATGCLSTPNLPQFDGLESYEGDWHHTGYWPKEGVDFSGKRVGIVGTGSSAIQSIPMIAAQADHLTVFQRTPNFSIPAWNGPIGEDAEREWKKAYPELRARARVSPVGATFEAPDISAMDVSAEERERTFERRWNEGSFNFLAAYSDLLTNKESNVLATDFVHRKIRSRVNDPVVAEMLCPKDHPLGTKRLCVDTDYYETYNRDNVALVDVKTTPINSIVPDGIRVGDTVYPLDAIVFATGFDAMTGALLNIDIRGRGGIAFRDKWADGPSSYLGVAVAGFPNLFTVTGPGSPSVLSNMMVSIEQHVEWIADCIAHMEKDAVATIEPKPEAESTWMAHVNQLASEMLYQESNTWYLGANIPGKPRVFLPYVGGVGHYRTVCDDVAAKGYEGFTLA
ncbi:MAG: NAD(P)/FAD-dependent oxidoreductase [Proteobacteria bacterium]|nr:NAD(P)/FAD-dependent oxidoreductase [Pseudomonadota bacterium]MDA1059742.1 NAD(P)/FAD-dependent oxidoreductase [Pseudomonadota bacterium]